MTSGDASYIYLEATGSYDIRDYTVEFYQGACSASIRTPVNNSSNARESVEEQLSEGSYTYSVDVTISGTTDSTCAEVTYTYAQLAKTPTPAITYSTSTDSYINIELSNLVSGAEYTLYSGRCSSSTRAEHSKATASASTHTVAYAHNNDYNLHRLSIVQQLSGELESDCAEMEVFFFPAVKPEFVFNNQAQEDVGVNYDESRSSYTGTSDRPLLLADGILPEAFIDSGAQVNYYLTSDSQGAGCSGNPTLSYSYDQDSFESMLVYESRVDSSLRMIGGAQRVNDRYTSPITRNGAYVLFTQIVGSQITSPCITRPAIYEYTGR